MLMMFGHAGELSGQALASLLRLEPMTFREGGLLAGLLGVSSLAGGLAVRWMRAERQVEQERRLREEAAGYLMLDLSPRKLERSGFARLMSRTIATRSSFSRAALLLRDGAGAMTVAGSVGFDDLSVEALNRWAGEAAASLLAGMKPDGVFKRRVGAASFAVELERRTALREGDPLATLGCARVHVTPLASAAGLLGVIVVCAEPRSAVFLMKSGARLQQLLEPIEALALRLSTQLGEVPGAHWAKSGATLTARSLERLAERRRARGPQLHRDGRTSHVGARSGRKAGRQAGPLDAAEQGVNWSAALVAGLPSLRMSPLPAQAAEQPSA